MEKISRIILSSAIFLLAVFIIGTCRTVNAGELKSPELSVFPNLTGNSNATYNFSFIPSSTVSYKALIIQFCTTPSGDCAIPKGMNTQSATISFSNIGIGYSGNSMGVGISGNQNGILNVAIKYPSKEQNVKSMISFSKIINSTKPDSYYARIIIYVGSYDTGVAAFKIVPNTKSIITPTPVCIDQICYSPE